ncbi:MAG: FAD-dependent oxidoreductase, partial [Anditalea sp.]
MPNQNYDLIVIGAGSGGLGAALGMLELGFRVLLIDKHADKIGGECLNTGCVPS